MSALGDCAVVVVEHWSLGTATGTMGKMGTGSVPSLPIELVFSKGFTLYYY